MLNFIREATEEEHLMALMLDDRVAKLDEQAKQIVRDRFNSLLEVRAGWDDEKEKGGKGDVSDLIGYAALIALANWKKIYKKGSEALEKHQACKHEEGAARVACKKKFMINYIESEIKRVETKRDQVCKKGYFQAACHRNINSRIDRLTKQLNKEKAGYKAAMQRAKAQKKKKK